MIRIRTTCSRGGGAQLTHLLYVYIYTDLSDPVDVYADWIDYCERLNKEAEQEEEQRQQQQQQWQQQQQQQQHYEDDEYYEDDEEEEAAYGNERYGSRQHTAVRSSSGRYNDHDVEDDDFGDGSEGEDSLLYHEL